MTELEEILKDPDPLKIFDYFNETYFPVDSITPQLAGIINDMRQKIEKEETTEDKFSVLIGYMGYMRCKFYGDKIPYIENLIAKYSN